ncbi:CaiB/BaiF CoA transferase family protein [Cupriavidus consociatus]|uniref:CaiB/BaiF CoA transferase family protein n=1 Tax=Cupriavidus consociatus TaxID=2821357 RepID=UPI001AE27671|nr:MULTISPECIES: CaiB/BaiF CoA-transferase family protein [unclassified Cupriavidus]MBP0625020.1 CoA transferase [Cupriavidus sp. LEh25]MDK2661755.1 CaiB/BaiF CoA-transferase family protein [Cupriavidus sp. LEh21]
MQKPLRNTRVLDLTNVLAGPFCCHQLAHMGAEVIKVETPGTGDLARQLGADAELNQRLMGVSFLAQNPGKQSITINLKHAHGKEIFRKLVRSADVVVENFRPGVMDRLGLGYETLKQDNPRLIYCAISGFGQDGPLAELPAYDQIIQGMSGVMSITGDPQTAPYRVGYPVSDTIGGLTAAFAVAASLADHQRTEGYFIDVSMLEATLATMGWVVSNHLIAGRAPVPMGNENMTASPSGTFRTGDGLLNIAANKQEQFEAVCRVVGKPELATDERFARRQARLANRAALTAALETELASKAATEWWPLLNEAGVPAGPVLSVPDTLAHPQVRDRGMIGEFADAPGVGRDIRVVRTGFKLNREAPAVDTPPPELGQHTRAILGSLGYSDADIDQLSQERAI